MAHIVAFFVLLSGATGAQGGSGNPLDMFSFSEDCLNFKVGAACSWTGTTVETSHRVPVYFIEVVRNPGDTVLGSGAGDVSIGTRMREVTHAFEVRIWDVSVAAWYALKAIAVGCALCDGPWGQVGPGYPVPPNKADDAPSICGMPESEQFNLFTKDDFSPVHLVYDSTVDAINWRFGCRDLKKSFEPETLKCSVPNLRGKNCVGEWGPLFPRQMASNNPDLVSAAMAAYRALHIASYAVESADLVRNSLKGSGHLQYAYPEAGDCFAPGSSIASVESNSEQSEDGRYAFWYWKDVQCCKSIAATLSCGSGSFGTGQIESGLSVAQSAGSVGQMPDMFKTPSVEGISAAKSLSLEDILQALGIDPTSARTNSAPFQQQITDYLNKNSP